MRRGRIAGLVAVVVCGGGATAVGTTSTMSTFVDAASNGPNSFAVVSDFSPPYVSTSVIAKAAGGDPGYVKPGGSYYVYANIDDYGSPAAGIASVTANVPNVSTSPTTSAVASGSWTIGGVTYNRRSGALTAKSALTEGSLGYGLTSVDSAPVPNSATQNFTVTADSTAPTATAIKSANVAGGTVGRAELGDTMSYTSSEPLDADSVIDGWDGSTLDVAAAIYYDSSTSQDLLVVGTTGGTQLTFPNVGLGRTDYITGNGPVYFGQTGTRSKLVRSGNVITLTLGTPSASTPTAAGTGSLRWYPNASTTDRAGNAISTTSILETGAASKDF